LDVQNKGEDQAQGERSTPKKLKEEKGGADRDQLTRGKEGVSTGVWATCRKLNRALGTKRGKRKEQNIEWKRE